MPFNHLEQLVAEWYEYQGYFVRRNVRVGPLDHGGFEGELDVVAVKPEAKQLVHIETSMDADSWEARETKLRAKFTLGDRYIRGLFPWFSCDEKIQKIAVFGMVKRAPSKTVGGGDVVLVGELVAGILAKLRDGNKSWSSGIVPEQFPLIRTIQMFDEFDVIDSIATNKTKNSTEPIDSVEHPPRKPGACKGLLTIVHDDDDHLKDFSEYMP